MDGGSAEMVRVRDQREEVLVSPSTEAGVFGCDPGSAETDSLSPSRQGGEGSLNLLQKSDGCVDDQTGVRKTGWFPEFRNMCPVIRAAVFDPPNKMDELQHIRDVQGPSSPSRCSTQEGSAALAEQDISGDSHPYECSRSGCGSNDGRFRLWLERGSPSLPGQWCLDTGGTLQFYKLEGTEGSTDVGSSFYDLTSGEISQDSFGQSGSFIVHPPSGLKEFSGSLRSFQRIVGILPRSPDFFGPCAHQGSLECACRSRFEGRSDFNGVVLGSRFFLLDLPSLRDSPGSGPFCYKGQFKIAFFRLPLSRRDGLSMGCPFPELESVRVSIRLPTTESSTGHGDETGTVSRVRLRSSSNVENTGLVSDFEWEMSGEDPSPQRLQSLSIHPRGSGGDGRALGPMGLASVNRLSFSKVQLVNIPSRDQGLVNSVSIQTGCPRISLGYSGVSIMDFPSRAKEVNSVAVGTSIKENSFSTRSLATQTLDQSLGVGSYPSHLKTNRLRAIAVGLYKRRFGKQAVDLILSQHRPSTCRQYQMVWDKFLDFLKERNVGHDDVGMNSVADFLAFHAVSLRKAYKTVAGYKCAVADPLYANFGISLETKEIRALLKGVYARRPPPRDGLMPECLSDLLDYLRGPSFEPLETARWGALIKKTLILFLLASGRRISEISEIQRVGCRKGDKVILKWLPLFRAKWESIDFHPEQPSVSRLVPLPGGDDLLCPVRAWGIFVRRRMGIRNYVDNARFWPCSMYALTYFCKRVIKDSLVFAGNSANCPMGPHQFRKLASSLSRKFFQETERYCIARWDLSQ